MPAMKPRLVVNKATNALIADCATGGRSTFSYHMDSDGRACISTIREHESDLHTLTPYEVKKLLFLIHEGDPSLRVDLEPLELGQVGVTVKWDPDYGFLRFTFTARHNGRYQVSTTSLTAEAASALAQLLAAPPPKHMPGPAPEWLSPPCFGLQLQL